MAFLVWGGRGVIVNSGVKKHLFPAEFLVYDGLRLGRT